MQHGQIFELKTTGADGQRLWAYRYRIDGRGSRRIQRGGYASADDAKDALQRALTATQRRKGRVRVTLADLAEEYLAQHDGQPETTAKLRWLLTKSTAAFGSMPLTELHAREIAAWRMTLPTGHRFEATQALRQTLARAVGWGLLDTNPAKTGVDNPPAPRREMRPFDTDGELEALATELGPLYGPMVLFAAATGLRPGEWLALEHRDSTSTTGSSTSAEPSASTASSPPRPTPPAPCRSSDPRSTRSTSSPRHPTRRQSSSPPPKAATSTCTTGDPATGAPPSAPPASPRPAASSICATLATVALRAGLGTCELSRYLDTSLINIDRTHGHLARDSHHHALQLLDDYNSGCGHVDAGGRSVDVDTPFTRSRHDEKEPASRKLGESPLPDSNRRPPSLPWRLDSSRDAAGGAKVPAHVRKRRAADTSSAAQRSARSVTHWVPGQAVAAGGRAW
jgi:hypothetical protein